jgi:hypothetical protein
MRGSRQGAPKATVVVVHPSRASRRWDVMRVRWEWDPCRCCSLSMGEHAALSGRGWVLGFDCSGSSMAVGESYVYYFTYTSKNARALHRDNLIFNALGHISRWPLCSLSRRLTFEFLILLTCIWTHYVMLICILFVSLSLVLAHWHSLSRASHTRPSPPTPEDPNDHSLPLTLSK